MAQVRLAGARRPRDEHFQREKSSEVIELVVQLGHRLGVNARRVLPGDALGQQVRSFQLNVDGHEFTPGFVDDVANAYFLSGATSNAFRDRLHDLLLR